MDAESSGNRSSPGAGSSGNRSRPEAGSSGNRSRPEAGSSGNHPLLVDAVLLASVPLALVGIHVFVPSARETLVFDHSSLDPLRMWTSAYVHLDVDHVESSVLGYLIAVAPTYVLYRFWGRRRQFWTVVAILLLVGPWAVSSASYLLYALRGLSDEVVSRGFSGIVGGLVGLLWASVPWYVADRYGRWRATEVGLLALMVPLVAVTFSVTAGVSTLTLVVAVGGLLLAVVNAVPEELQTDPAGLAASVGDHADEVLWLGTSVLVVGFLLVVLFPASVVGGGVVINVYAHAAGLFFGIVTTTVVLAMAID